MDTTISFMDVATSFNAKILYHEEMHPDGRFQFHYFEKDWFFDSNEEYWDFDIEFNGYLIKDLTSTWQNNSYVNYLSELYDDFRKEHSINNLHRLSKIDCTSLLQDEIEQLDFIYKQFITKDVPEGIHNDLKCVVTSHRAMKVSYSDTNKIDDDEHFISACLGNLLIRQKEIIKIALELLKNRLTFFNKEQGNRTDSEGQILAAELKWEKNDTDLLELITALLETKSISKNNVTVSRKEAIEIFSRFFNKEIKDAESKLSRATERKKDISPFLSSLKESFDKYAIGKEQK